MDMTIGHNPVHKKEQKLFEFSNKHSDIQSINANVDTVDKCTTMVKSGYVIPVHFSSSTSKGHLDNMTTKKNNSQITYKTSIVLTKQWGDAQIKSYFYFVIFPAHGID